MSCEHCAGAIAWSDQMTNTVNDLLETEKMLRDVIRMREVTIEKLTRELREARDELRLRRAATGYLPVLDRPEG